MKTKPVSNNRMLFELVSMFNKLQNQKSNSKRIMNTISHIKSTKIGPKSIAQERYSVNT